VLTVEGRMQVFVEIFRSLRARGAADKFLLPHAPVHVAVEQVFVLVEFLSGSLCQQRRWAPPARDSTTPESRRQGRRR